ncbi:MAG: hypothetical protein KGJ23_09105 [Euryarchaeota archaeon]|nr:hypothetical protein [Euryarchaeota archaeon]MDE1836762.1 hypothetical protein [Euryarchaeota archaeon]MDE1879780.1 hypothetical protein [Euryarchaeota archaeon]MDE2044746.1 hypothetical protein [Thermoplasmata archaeon]
MSLRPTPMSRVALVGLRDDEDRILSFLHDRGVVQVEAISKEALAHLVPERAGEEHRKLAEELLRFKALVAALPPVRVEKRVHFADIPALLRAASKMTIDEEVRAAKREEDGLLTERKVLQDNLRLAREYAFFPEDLSLLTARSLLSYLGESPTDRYAPFREEVAALSHEVLFVEEALPKQVRFVVAVPRARADAFGRLAQKHSVRLTAAPDLQGTPRELVPRLEKELADVEGKLAAVKGRLRRISDEWYATILPIEEQLQVEARKADIHGRLAGAKNAFALEGFVPTPEVPRLRAELERVTGGRTELYDIAATGDAPTMMRNPKGTNVFEFFIRFFSLPMADEIDPTMVFAVVFPFFFGLMIGDAGYAAFILAVCLWMIWRIGNPKAGPTLVPGFLVRFTTMVMPAPAMKQLAKCLVPGCLIGIFVGVGFDAYFGFSLAQLTGNHFDFALWPGKGSLPGQVTYIAKLLLLSVYIGLATVTLGLVFGALNKLFHHETRHAVGKVAWIVIAWGITLLGLSLIHHPYPGSWLITPNNPSPSALAFQPFQYVLIAITVAMVPTIILTEGGLAAIELPSIVSHVLSYARLVGILLASVILAYVINSIAVLGGNGQTAMITHGVGYAVMAVVLVLVGAVFNIVVGVFEPGIQGARLMYVEYFSKFYTGNGKPFKPFGGRRSFTLPQHPAVATTAPVPPPTPTPPS